ncbi:MAG: hypothetical protein CVV61_04705, partial [Tenericutes bacterium HGW-Tenericutes-6]
PFDIVVIKKGSYEDISIGDVIVFQGNVMGREGLVIHRVVGVHPDGYFLTKGDKASEFEAVDQDLPEEIAQPPITEDIFQGFYHTKITFLKPIARLASTSRGLIFGALAIFLAIMIVTEVIHMMKTIKEEKKKTLKEAHEKEMAELSQFDKEKLYQEILDEELKKAKKPSKND